MNKEKVLSLQEAEKEISSSVVFFFKNVKYKDLKKGLSEQLSAYIHSGKDVNTGEDCSEMLFMHERLVDFLKDLNQLSKLADPHSEKLSIDSTVNMQ